MSEVPSIQILAERRLTSYTMKTEFHTPFEWFMQIGWNGLYDIHVPKKNPHFFVTTEPNQMGR